MHPNLAKQRLKEGRLALGLGLRQARTVDIASAAATCGFDWLFIDMEHNAMSVDTAAQIASAAPGMGVTPIVRVPGHEHYHATRLLDNGAQGIVAPHVDDAAQARRIAEACLYAPLGKRSIPGAQPQLAFKPIASAEATRLVNEQILVVVMLESPRAIENAEEIAAVPGVDVLLIGTSDLSFSYGLRGRQDDPQLLAAIDKVVKAGQKHGKPVGRPAATPEQAAAFREQGFSLFQLKTELGFMASGARDFAESRGIRGPGTITWSLLAIPHCFMTHHDESN